MDFAILSRIKKLAMALPHAVDHVVSGGALITAPPPGASTELGRLLWTWPRPLIHPQARLLVIHSQKSASTNVAIWYLRQIGHAQAARDFHYWPHRYLSQVLNYSEFYRKAYELEFSKFTVVRVVRNPFERAVSSFRHALKHGHVDKEIAKRLDYHGIADKGLSFSTFIDFLERLDLGSCDPHFSFQRHPVEDKLPVHYLINVSSEDLFARLNEVEAAIGLPRSDMAADPWIKYLRQHNRPEKLMFDDDDLYTKALTRRQAIHGPWPRYEAFMQPEARERLARLYALDINAYL